MRRKCGTAIRGIAPGVHAADGIVQILRVGPDSEMDPDVVRVFAIYAVMGHATDGGRIRMLHVFTLPTPASRGHAATLLR